MIDIFNSEPPVDMFQRGGSGANFKYLWQKYGGDVASPVYMTETKNDSLDIYKVPTPLKTQM